MIVFIATACHTPTISTAIQAYFSLARILFSRIEIWQTFPITGRIYVQCLFTRIERENNSLHQRRYRHPKYSTDFTDFCHHPSQTHNTHWKANFTSPYCEAPHLWSRRDKEFYQAETKSHMDRLCAGSQIQRGCEFQYRSKNQLHFKRCNRNPPYSWSETHIHGSVTQLQIFNWQIHSSHIALWN